MRYIVFIVLILSNISVFGQKVYKTPSGKKYHTSTCRYVKNVSHSLSIDEAIKTGLSACKQCNPNGSNPQRVSSNTRGLGIKSGEAQGANRNSVQCKGITKAGTRCKHMTKNVNGYCHQHEPK